MIKIEKLLEDDNLLKQYYELFGILPSKMMMISYKHDIYQKLMKDAINRGKPLSDKEISKAFEDVNVDIVR